MADVLADYGDRATADIESAAKELEARVAAAEAEGRKHEAFLSKVEVLKRVAAARARLAELEPGLERLRAESAKAMVEVQLLEPKAPPTGSG